MAQVLAPIVQSSGSITMLHTSPDAFQNPSSPQPHHQQSRTSQPQRSHGYTTQNGGVGYRGASSAPIAPYAFSSTPQLRQENRSSSAPGNPYNTQGTMKLGHPSHASSSSDSTVSTASSSRSMIGHSFGTKDDSVLASEQRKSGISSIPASAITLSTSVPDLSLASFDSPVKPSPDRYRRNVRRNDSSNTVVPTTSTFSQPQQPLAAAGSRIPNVPPFLNSPEGFSRPSHHRANSADDMQLGRQAALDQAKRYRRRSLGGFEVNASAYQESTVSAVSTNPMPTAQRQSPNVRPSSSSSRHGSNHERNGSAGSVSSSAGSTRPSSKQESNPIRPTNTQPAASVTRSNGSPVAVPPRGSSEPAKRLTTPSPLSKPVSDLDSAPNSPEKHSGANIEQSLPSPAAQRLAALNDKESSKGMKSRLRRAFSFGSAAELRRASAENNLSAERAKLRKERYQSEREAEDAAIAAKQEAAGIGAGIYSGQGGFSGSTDNLSISSTASSASIMLRKMGSGMKKGGRSIKGLFRPKSVIGVPAADKPVTQPSLAQVSMVTVEAEREKVNVNVNPHDQVGGGTGYPKLERNSLDAARAATNDSALHNDSLTRKSIIGGDRERAEVLSSMKKGILKRTGTSSDTPSPVVKPVDVSGQTDTPKSSAPSTPNDDSARPVNIHINGEDYFGGVPRIPNVSSRSLPTTPQGNRNISFSPRIQFHDAWSSSEYDRRGDIATCNRLTPMLAQQIKEELNTFKMEMEVHELSKPHTHFF